MLTDRVFLCTTVNLLRRTFTKMDFNAVNVNLRGNCAPYYHAYSFLVALRTLFPKAEITEN